MVLFCLHGNAVSPIETAPVLEASSIASGSRVLIRQEEARFMLRALSMDAPNANSTPLDDEVVRLTCVTHGIASSYGFRVSVVKEQNANTPGYLFQCRQHRLHETDKVWTRSVDMDRFDSLIRQLVQLSVPVIPDEILVCDGTQYELMINRGSNGVTYRWTDPPPPGYESIGRFARSLEKLGGMKRLVNND